MDIKRLLIIGGVGVLAIGAYFYFKPKSKKNQTGSITNKPAPSSSAPSTQNNTGGQSTDPNLNTPKDSNVKTLTEQEMLVITSLRDTILNDMKRKGTYKRSATRNAVQRDIDSNMEVLKSLGYTLDLNNTLVKIDK